jgi:hypothetical protein
MEAEAGGSDEECCYSKKEALQPESIQLDSAAITEQLHQESAVDMEELKEEVSQ